MKPKRLYYPGLMFVIWIQQKKPALIIADMGAKKVLITMGSRGALLLDNKQFSHIRASLPSPSIPPVPAMHLMARWQLRLPPETVWFRPQPGLCICLSRC
jgi:hypothetical protein